jgi:hypothetical protein
MPDIEFKDLNQSIGTELFSDAESFLEDLTDDAVNIVGGISEGATASVITSDPGRTFQLTSIPPEHAPIMTTTVYNPNPGGNSGINCTGFYTTGHNPHKPRHRRPIHPIYATTNDI